MGARSLIDGSERRTFAMRSPVNWGVLGLLLERQGYGYELHHRFQRTYRELIVLSCQAQIYKGLDALEERGLIEVLPSEVALPARSVKPTTRYRAQPKTRYRALAEAVPAYRDWLITQVTQEGQCVELLALQVGALPASDALVVVDRYEQHLLSERRAAPPMPDGASVLARELAEHAKDLETGLALKWATHARRGFEASIER
jgi:DNA-binding PadR family transcriptional regulator